MSYQVFARKYRPRTFDDVLGQDHVVQTLKNAISRDRLHHAYLFVGPRGTGKTSTARILAKALNCPGGPSVDFNPDDPLCLEIADGRSLDVLEIDGASNNSVDQVRELRENIKFAPSSGKFRIYYIDEVHMLSGAAFNALLKTLEEPPPHAKFIFATTEAQKILPTIISRCQRFDLRRIPDQIIADHLLHIARSENVNLSEVAAAAIAKGADGGMRDAQSMLDQLVAFCGTEIDEGHVLEIFGFTSIETITGLAGAIISRDTVSALRAVHEQNDGGKDLSKLLADLIGYFRALLIHQVAPSEDDESMAVATARDLADQASNIGTDRLLTLIGDLSEADAAMKWNPNKKLHFEIAVIKAIQTLSEATISDVVEALSGRQTLPAAPPATKPKPATPPASSPPRQAPVRQSEPAAPAATQPSPAQSSPPATSSPPPTAAPAQAETPAPPPAQADPPGNHSELWEQLVESLQTKLIGPWVAAGVYVESRGKNIIVAFHPEDSHKRDQLDRPSARQKVVDALVAISGENLDVKFEIKEDIDRPAPPVPEEDDDDEQTPPPPAQENPQEAPQPAASTPPQAAPNAAPEPPKSSEDFYSDPLIKDALEIFEAKIKS